jgi:hypothetical protein
MLEDYNLKKVVGIDISQEQIDRSKDSNKQIIKKNPDKIQANKIGNVIVFTKQGKIKTAENGFKIENPDLSYFDNADVLEELKTDYNKTDKSNTLSEYISNIKLNPNSYKNYNKFISYNFNRIFKNGGDLTYDKTQAVNIGDIKHKIRIKEVDLKKNHLHLLDNDGNLIYNLKGGERIMSIPDTEDIFKLVLEDSDDKLADLMIDILDRHDVQEAQYVSE